MSLLKGNLKSNLVLTLAMVNVVNTSQPPTKSSKFILYMLFKLKRKKCTHLISSILMAAKASLWSETWIIHTFFFFLSIWIIHAPYKYILLKIAYSNTANLMPANLSKSLILQIVELKKKIDINHYGFCPIDK